MEDYSNWNHTRMTDQHKPLMKLVVYNVSGIGLLQITKEILAEINLTIDWLMTKNVRPNFVKQSNL